jgi:Tol biopolymer transport system component
MVGPALLMSAVALALLLPGVATAAVPAGPRLTFFEAEFPPGQDSSPASSVSRLVSADPGGHDRLPLPHAPSVRVQPSTISWDADGGEFAFRGSKTWIGPVSAYIARADGTGVRPIAGTTGATTAVLSPDGRWLAFARRRERQPRIDPKDPRNSIGSLSHAFSSETTWIVPTAGGKARRLTPWGNNRIAMPSAFSPDGSTLAVSVERAGAQLEVDAIEPASGATRTLEAEASEAAYSPDGNQIAFISYRDHESVPGFDEPEATSELYVADADGTGAHPVTYTPNMQEHAPNWDPSGTRLAYLRFSGGGLGIFEGSVVESNADGSCPQVIATPAPPRRGGETFVLAPTWWAGAERGAGPLSC